MSRLLRQSHPYLILFCPLGSKQCKDGNNHEDHHHTKLDKGIGCKTTDHQRFIVAYLDIVMSRIIQLYLDILALCQEMLALYSRIP